jgi:hypothetical protein
MLDPDQPAGWYRLTRRGAQLKTRVDVEAFRRGNFRGQLAQGPDAHTDQKANAGLDFEPVTSPPVTARPDPRGAMSGAGEVFSPLRGRRAIGPRS